MSDAIWVTWENQRRNRALASSLEVELYEWSDLAAAARPRRYLAPAWRTWRLLRRRRPRVVICQNPSLVLALLVLALRGVFGYKAVVDAHNAGLLPLEGRSWWLNRLSRLIQRGADLTLVTNETLARLVEGNGGRAFVLPDPIPTFRLTPACRPAGPSRIVVVCTYAEDEPYRAVFSAAGLLPPDVQVQVTGNFARAGIDPSSVPPNVRLTGYLPEEAYVRLLADSDAVVDLTSRSDCLVCGAYEGIAAGTPLVLSDTEVNRAYFSKGVVYTGHEPEAIAHAISEALASAPSLRAAIAALERELRRDWESRRRRLLDELDQLGAS